MEIYVKKLYFRIFSFFLFSNMILLDALTTCIAASNTASDDVTNNRIFIQTVYSCAHFVVENDEKCLIRMLQHVPYWLLL